MLGIELPCAAIVLLVTIKHVLGIQSTLLNVLCCNRIGSMYVLPPLF